MPTDVKGPADLLQLRRELAARTASRGRGMCSDPLLYPQGPPDASGQSQPRVYRYVPEHCVRVNPDAAAARRAARPRQSDKAARAAEAAQTKSRDTYRANVRTLAVEAKRRRRELIPKLGPMAGDVRNPYFVVWRYLAQHMSRMGTFTLRTLADPAAVRAELGRIEATWDRGFLAAPGNADLAALCRENLLVQLLDLTTFSIS